jgi:hypothetical protein
METAVTAGRVAEGAARAVAMTEAVMEVVVQMAGARAEGGKGAAVKVADTAGSAETEARSRTALRCSIRLLVTTQRWLCRALLRGLLAGAPRREERQAASARLSARRALRSFFQPRNSNSS